jgi:hypothetical protein
MATVTPGVEGSTLAFINLGTAQTGNADSSNTIDRGSAFGPALLQINATAGATPTVTVNILGSVDGTNFFNVPYATTAAPGTAVVTALTLTATAITQYFLPVGFAWRFLKLNYSANTNVTLTADVLISADK